MLTIVVELNTKQMQKAADQARRLHDALRARGVPDGHGLRKADATAEMEAGGAAAEMAAAQALKVAWSAGLPGHDKYGPDVGKRTQVRSTSKPRRSHSLIVRETDIRKYGNVPFVLVVQEGNSFELRGWLMAGDAHRVGEWWDGGDGGRPPAWFVREQLLNSFSSAPEGGW